jgi:hypothetical protein
LTSAVEAAGVDLERVAANLSDAGGFIEGPGEGGPRGALIADAGDPRTAQSTATELEPLLRGLDGKTQVDVTAGGARVAIGLGGLAPALKALDPATEPLSTDPEFRRAAESLGKLPISAFVDGPEFVDVAATLAPPGVGPVFREFGPYLRKVAWVALGAAPGGDEENAKMIVSFE